MSATTVIPAQPRQVPSRPPAPAGERVTQARAIHSEWIKWRTLRSSWFMLLGAVLAPIVIDTLIGYNTGKQFTNLAPEDAAPSGVLQGYFLAQLLIGVLGVLFVSGEYATGMIRSTLAAVPKRTPVLIAKAVVFGTVSLVAMLPTMFIGFFLAMAFRSHYGHGSSLSDPTVLRVVIGTGVYLALIGLLGGALGWIVRSTPGGISTLVAILLVIPVILEVLPGTWAKDIGKFLPGEAGGSFVSSVHQANTLSPGAGLDVLIGWVLVSLLAAGILLKRRDG
jgi:ABC-2 type transport system permease protein